MQNINYLGMLGGALLGRLGAWGLSALLLKGPRGPGRFGGGGAPLGAGRWPEDILLGAVGLGGGDLEKVKDGIMQVLFTGTWPLSTAQDRFSSSHFTCDHHLPSRRCPQAEVWGQWWWRWRYRQWWPEPPSGLGGSSAPHPSSGPVPGTHPWERSGLLQSTAGPTALRWWTPSPSVGKR